MPEKQQRRVYSEAFKRQVVQEYEQGASVTSLMRKYGIGGAHTIKRWVQKYGRQPYRTETVYIQTAEDLAHVRRLEEELQALKTLVADLTLENRMLRAALEVAGIDPKKAATPSSNTPAGKETSP